MKKHYLLIVIIIVVLVIVGIYYIVSSWNPSQEEQPQVVVDNLSRKDVMEDVSEKIAEISPEDPVLGGSWYVVRFWFIKNSNNDFYVEYEDGHIMRRLLLEVKEATEEINYKITAFFEPGEVDWQIKQGEDKFFGESLDLYEYSEELESWIKKN